MIYEEPKTGSFAVPVITILLVMAGIVMLLISNVGSHQQARVFVQVQQPGGRKQIADLIVEYRTSVRLNIPIWPYFSPRPMSPSGLTSW
jgi:hypothetical protein